MSEQVGNYETRIGTLNVENDTCKERNTELLNNIRSLNETLESQITDHNNKYSFLQNEMSTIQQQCDISQESVTKLRQDILQHERNNDQLSECNASLKNQLDDLRNQFNTLTTGNEGKIGQLDNLIAQQSATNTALSQKNEDMMLETNALTNANAGLLATLQELNEQNAKFKEEFDKYRSTLQQLTSKLTKSEQCINELKKKNTELENEVSTITTEMNERIEAGRVANESVSQQLTDLLDDKRNLESTNGLLEKRLQECGTEMKQLKENVGDCEEIRSRCVELQQTVSDMTEVVSQKEINIRELDGRIEYDKGVLTNQADMASARINSLIEVCIRSYDYCATIYGLISELNVEILESPFNGIKSFEPISQSLFDHGNDTIYNTLMNKFDDMVSPAKRIVQTLKDKDADIKNELNNVSKQCGFHTTPTLTASRLLSWASIIFSAIRARKENFTYNSVDEYCNSVKEDIVIYTSNIDRLLKNVKGFKDRLLELTTKFREHMS